MIHKIIWHLECNALSEAALLSVAVCVKPGQNCEKDHLAKEAKNIYHFCLYKKSLTIPRTA